MLSTVEIGTFVDGPVMLCAWCVRYEQPHAAARDLAAGEWRAIPHEQARILHLASGTSHGICPWCLPALAAEWEIPLPPPRPAQTVPVALALAG